MVDTETGEVRLWRCRRDGCPWCGPINGGLVGLAIALARPERVVTLTQAPGGRTGWQANRRALNRLTEYLRRRGYRFQWAGAVEQGKGGMVHWQLVQHGQFVPQRELSTVAVLAGFGPVADIQQVRSRTSSARYPLKALAAAAYTVKGAEMLAEHRELNGGRLFHTSRAFWRDDQGRPVASKREAVKLALRAAYGQQTGSWVVVRESDLPSMVRGGSHA